MCSDNSVEILNRRMVCEEFAALSHPNLRLADLLVSSYRDSLAITIK